MTALFQAVRKGALSEVRSVLQSSNVDINATDPYGFSALHEASRDGLVEICELLLDHGAHPDGRSRGGSTALHLAALNGKEKVCSLLLEWAADCNARALDGRTPLHEASIRGHMKCLEVLLAAGGSPNIHNAYGKTAVDVAGQENELATDRVARYLQGNNHFSSGEESKDQERQCAELENQLASEMSTLSKTRREAEEAIRKAEEEHSRLHRERVALEEVILSVNAAKRDADESLERLMVAKNSGDVDCVVCMESQRNTTFVHTDEGVGHTACCFQCAQTIVDRNDSCPICRNPISFIIRNFTS